jgi:hypothetical protein
LVCVSAQAKPEFISSDLPQGSELMVCDLDGDGLDDLVLQSGLDLSIFHQDSKTGFTRVPQQTHHLEPRPCIVWPARLSGRAASLLVMNSDGVDGLGFTNRESPATIQQLIRQPTIVPEPGPLKNAKFLSLSVETGGDWPLLLVPTSDGLQVWQHQDVWRRAQVIEDALDATLWPSIANPGYATSRGFDFSVGDVNGDGRGDLIVRRGRTDRSKTYSLYIQQTNGLFAAAPAPTYKDMVEQFSWLCWADLNRDGRADLIRSVCVKEPSFVPGIPSAKVLVSTYVADEQGRIPSQPQQVFRKNDFKAGLPVVDVDGDRFLDLVLINRHMDSRDDVARIVTTKRLDYSLRFYFYRPGTGFPTQADCLRKAAFHLNQDELLHWIGNENYEDYVSFAGDFNGDAKADLLVREQDNEIVIYFFVSREKGFSLKPDLRFSCPELIDGLQTRDLNHDGVSDLLVGLKKQDVLRIFISQK